jgi:hypothetical protein
MRDHKEYETVSFWREEDDDILFFKYAPRLEMTIDVAKAIVQSRLDYCQGVPSYMVIDATNIKSATKEARDYMNSREGGLKGVLGGAFLSNNVMATLAINLFLKVSNLPVPAKFFTDKGEAIKWLRKIRNEKLQAA